MSEYKEEIIDHYKNPRNFGEISDADQSLTEVNSSCGDVISVTLSIKNSRITDIKWRGVGCAISTAAASMLSEKVVGMNLNDIEIFGEKGVIDLLGGGVNPGRMKCATLAYRALTKMLNKENE